jgi:hypothetical protein
MAKPKKGSGKRGGYRAAPVHLHISPYPDPEDVEIGLDYKLTVKGTLQGAPDPGLAIYLYHVASSNGFPVVPLTFNATGNKWSIDILFSDAATAVPFMGLCWIKVYRSGAGEPASAEMLVTLVQAW